MTNKSYILSRVIIYELILCLQMTSEVTGGGGITPSNLDLGNLSQVSPLAYIRRVNLNFTSKIRKGSMHLFSSPSGMKELQLITILNPDYRLNDTKRKRPLLDIHEMSMNLSDETQIMIIIWRIENRELFRTDLTNYKEFKSTDAYLIMRAQRNEKPDDWRIHYWIGKNSSIEDAVDIAYCAMQMDFEVHSTVKIHREVEGRESTTFEALFQQENIAEPGLRKKVRKASATMKGKRMFLVRGADQPYLVEVDISAKHLVDGDCVIFSSAKIHVFCKNVASEPQKRAAEELAKYIRDRRGLNEDNIIFHHQSDQLFWKLPSGERKKFSLFLNELERPPAGRKKPIVDNPLLFEPKEIRRILGQTEMNEDGFELFQADITRIFLNDYLKAESKPYANEPLLSLFKSKDCYIIDSRSNAGLFVWIGRKAAMKVRRECAGTVELNMRAIRYYGKDGYLPNSVIYIHEDDVPLGMKDIQELIRYLNHIDLYL